jgi:fimbrial chaperone protein
VLRITGQPVAAEESDRVVVDELPDPARKKAGTVNFVVRYSIPVFFRKPDAAPPKIAWGVSRVKGKLVVTASNLGDSRLRIADLQLTQKGNVIGGRDGLVGYVLGRARMQWVIDADKSVSPGPVTLRGHSETGPFDAKVAISSR